MPLAPYKPLKWQVKPWRDKSLTVLLTGGAGGGKSRLALEKLHGYNLKYSGALTLFLRKTRVSVKRSGVRALEREVIRGDRSIRHLKADMSFEYPQGSSIIYGGMADDEQREGLRSLNADFVLMEEANRFLEADYNEMLARLRGRAAPWRQIVLCTNPDSPNHWINQRLIVGKEAEVYYSYAKDNPNNPPEYLETLERLTGVEKERLAHGKWVQAEGLIFDTWSDGPIDGNVTYDAEYRPEGGPVYWGVDDGYSGQIDKNTGTFTATSHPRVFLLAQMRGGILNVFHESAHIKMLSDAQLDSVTALDYELPMWAAVDKSAAELKGRLAARGIYTRNGPGTVDESIKTLRSWLAADENGVRRVRVHPRCELLRSEMVSYVADSRSGKPVKAFDHAVDALRYLVWTIRHEAM